MSDLLQSVNATRETIEAATNGHRPDLDAWRAIEAERLTDAEKELARDEKSLEAAIAKVADLKAEVAFDEMKVASRKAGLATFDRLHAKAAK